MGDRAPTWEQCDKIILFSASLQPMIEGCLFLSGMDLNKLNKPVSLSLLPASVLLFSFSGSLH